MRTIALRFSDNFAPAAGTIAEHKKCIFQTGHVWYGKLGTVVSDKVCKVILANDSPRILLIHSEKTSRYWAYVDKVIKDTPPLNEIPEYYREQTSMFHTWFRVLKIEEAEKNVMAACKVASSGAPLSVTSRSSMSPYFIIEYAKDIQNNEADAEQYNRI